MASANASSPVTVNLDDDDDFCCEICCKLFGEGDLQPRSLPCGHTMCHKCLDKTMRQNGRCAFCRIPIAVESATQVPVNYTLKKLADKFRIENEKRNTVPPALKVQKEVELKKKMDELQNLIKDIKVMSINNSEKIPETQSHQHAQDNQQTKKSSNVKQNKQPNISKDEKELKLEQQSRELDFQERELKLREREQLHQQRELENQREHQRLEHQRLEHQRLEHQRLEHQRLEHQRLENQRQESQRLENQRLEHQRLENQRREQQKLEHQRQENQRLENQRQEQQMFQHQTINQQHQNYNNYDIGLESFMQPMRPIKSFTTCGCIATICGDNRCSCRKNDNRCNPNCKCMRQNLGCRN